MLNKNEQMGESHPDTSSGPPDLVSDDQKVIQRKLGRCILRLQQYEGLMKALITHHEIAGPVDELDAIRSRRGEVFSKLTLGQLVNELDGTYLRVDSIAPASGTDPERVDPTRIWLHMRMGLQLDASVYEQTVAGLKELVWLRNEIAHHFLERFDIWTTTGCAEGDVYLDRSYELIDRRYLELRAWAETTDQARKVMESFFASQTWKDWVVHGIAPDGSVHWPGSTIVQCLREAERSLAVNGWTPLDDAIARIRSTHADHDPERYRCRSWRHVLHESRLFEIRREAATDTTSSKIWFRSRPR